MDGIKFEKADKPHKKCKARVPNNKVVYFGDNKYQQYEDKTLLKVYYFKKKFT